MMLREMSRQLEVHWAGFIGRTDHLQEAGWEISAEEDVYARRMCLAFRHQALGMYGITAKTEYPYHYGRGLIDPRYSQFGEHQDSLVNLRMMALGKHIDLHFMGRVDWGFKPVDAKPQLCAEEVFCFKDLVHFAPAASKRDLILPEAAVPDLLDRILQLQQPARKDRAKARVAARILTLA